MKYFSVDILYVKFILLIGLVVMSAFKHKIGDYCQYSLSPQYSAMS